MPTTGKYALIQIGAVYLTNDATVSGKPCKTEVKGLDSLSVTKAIRVINALSGKPKAQISEALLGNKISIKCFDVEPVTYAAVIDEMETSLDTDTPITISFENNPYGNFDLIVIPDVKPVDHEFKFLGDYAKEVSFNFQVES